MSLRHRRGPPRASPEMTKTPGRQPRGLSPKHKLVGRESNTPADGIVRVAIRGAP